MTRQVPESSVKRAAADYLQILLNRGKICWFTRLNSGGIVVGAGRKRWITLAGAGSPDFVGFDSHGCGFAVECKSTDGKLSVPQRRVLGAMIAVDVRVFVIRPDNIKTLKELEK